MTRSRRLFLALAAVAAVAGGFYLAMPHEQPYRSFERPDGAYRVVVLRRPGLLPIAPGQSGDAPGTVELQDRTGRVLAREPVEMVQLVEEVDWADDHARIKYVADWDLKTLGR